MKTVFDWLIWVEEKLIGFLAICSLLLAVTEMVLRYFLPRQLPDWTSEVVIYLITAAVMLSGGLLVTEGRHVRADLLLRLGSPSLQRSFEIGFCLVGIAVCAVFFERGIGIVEFALMLDARSDSSLQFPVFIYYAFVPLAFGLMLFHYVIRLARYIFLFDPKTMISTEVDLENAD